MYLLIYFLMFFQMYCLMYLLMYFSMYFLKYIIKKYMAKMMRGRLCEWARYALPWPASMRKRAIDIWPCRPVCDGTSINIVYKKSILYYWFVSYCFSFIIHDLLIILGNYLLYLFIIYSLFTYLLFIIIIFYIYT